MGTGLEWINIFGLIIVVLMLLPNLIYAIRFRKQKKVCRNRTMKLFEHGGRIASILFMVFHVGFGEFGFPSSEAFIIYLGGNIGLLLIYWVVWTLYFEKQSRWKAVILTVVPILIFLLSGVMLRYVLLVISALVFGVAHIYVTLTGTMEK